MKRFFTPGPTHLYPTVPNHIQTALSQHIPSISHRSEVFKNMYGETVQALREVFTLPSNWEVLFFASATEIWERLLQNCISTHSFHFVNGSFSDRFFMAGKKLKLGVMNAEADWGQGFSEVGIPGGVEMINFTRNETSTGVMTPESFIYDYRTKHPDPLITVDMVSSAPYTDWDWSQIDAAYFSVQKCFGLPAGLGVLLCGPRILERAQEKANTGVSIGTYHSFPAMAQKTRQNQTIETPNGLAIYLLGKVCQDMLARGVKEMRQTIRERAQILYEFLEAHPRWSPFVEDTSFRSQTVIVADLPEGSKEVLEQLAGKDLIIGNGYGKMKGKQLRIANFPAFTDQDFEVLLTELRKIS